jgi:ADP-dependent phosphofructokinase/glucokinase
MLIHKKEVPFIDNNFAYKEIRESVVYILGQYNQNIYNIKDPSVEDFSNAVEYCKKHHLIKPSEEIDKTLEDIKEHWNTIKQDIVTEINRRSLDIQQ